VLRAAVRGRLPGWPGHLTRDRDRARRPFGDWRRSGASPMPVGMG
jgi:hypothetical protein